MLSCLRYCKSTSFQANHNPSTLLQVCPKVVCDTAKVRVFKQITTLWHKVLRLLKLFAILQKYEFSSKSQRHGLRLCLLLSCLRYCKSTSFQANHNVMVNTSHKSLLFAILQKYEFSSKSQRTNPKSNFSAVVCDTAKVRVFRQTTTKSLVVTNKVVSLQ